MLEQAVLTTPEAHVYPHAGIGKRYLHKQMCMFSGIPNAV